MTIYTVLAPPEAATGVPDPERYIFIKEGFCWPAFFFTPFWLLFRRMWLVFLLHVVASLGVGYLASRLPGVGGAIVFLFGVLVALEANNLRRWTLERRGHRLVGVAAGDRREEAEFRFFSGWRGPERAAKPVDRPKPIMPSILPPVRTGEIVGLFPRPGGAA